MGEPLLTPHEDMDSEETQLRKKLKGLIGTAFWTPSKNQLNINSDKHTHSNVTEGIRYFFGNWDFDKYPHSTFAPYYFDA